MLRPVSHAIGVCDEDMAPLILAECNALAAWIQHGKTKAKGKNKTKDRRFKFSAGLEPTLTLGERETALKQLEKETKCAECGEIGHCAGDLECKGTEKMKHGSFMDPW